MNTLIAYATKYGCTEKCAATLAEKLDGKVELCNLAKTKSGDISQYDKIIVGGSIYIGKIQKEVTQFCAQNLCILKDKKIGLFICCMRDGEEGQTELKNSFPAELVSTAIVKDCFGGEFSFKKMKAFDKLIVKKVVKIDKDVSNILEENIKKFAQLMNNA